VTRLSLTIATENYDRIRPLLDGTVEIEGCDVNYLTMPVEEIFHRAWRNREFDVCEIGLSPYLIAVSRGIAPYVAVPVFLSRTFRHSAVYVRTDRGIDSAAALRGRRVGIPEYQQSAALWVRGLIADEEGIRSEDITWVQAGLETPGRRDTFPLNVPAGFPLEKVDDRTLSALLANGEIDAVISARAPSSFLTGMPNIGRLYPDYRAVEKAYVARTGIFPIMHALGIRNDVNSKHPWLAASLLKAFSAARDIAIDELREVVSLHISLPWIAAELESTEAVMGRDFWSYGITKNRVTLDSLARYSYEQYLSVRQLSVEEMFARGTLDETRV
jgi:4,5-dihydroxyphthalate decarboxylase